MERVIPLAGESAVPESPFSSGIPTTGMERLWSLAVATSGNLGGVPDPCPNAYVWAAGN
jgi:hypothetical protein